MTDENTIEWHALEEAFATAGVGFDDANLDLYNALDRKRFTELVGELIEGNPEAARLRREKHVPEDQPMDVPVSGEVAIVVPRGLTLSEWALSERYEDPVEVAVYRPPEDPLRVGSIRREDVRRRREE
jgi:hypothetical protein